MLIHPSLHACATPTAKVFAHTHVRDAACCRHGFCGAVEDVQFALTLFCSGAAHVCHALRVEELREQLDVDEEDGDRQEEEEEVESGEASQGECAMWMTMDGGEMRSELEP